MVVFFEEHLPSYRVPILRHLNESLQDRFGMPLHVVHGAPPTATGLNTVDGEASLGFSHVKVPTLWVGGDVLSARWVLPELYHTVPDVVMIRGTIRNVELLPLVAYYRLRDIPVILWGQGYSKNRAFQPDTNMLDRVHLALVRSADAYICYTDNIRSVLAEHVDRDRLFVANNTIDVREALSHRDQLLKEGKDNVKRTLGLNSHPYVSYIGRLQQRKRVTDLLDTIATLQQSDNKVGALIIGDGPERGHLETYAENLNLTDVRFVGAQYGEDAGKYLFASDAMVLPGALGLAVNHALAYGVPVISQHDPRPRRRVIGHGPEADHVKHGETGYLANIHAEDGIADGIRCVLREADTYSRAAATYAARELTQDRMMEGFMEAVSFVSCR